jgi:histidinol-phosphate aminotransferase
MDDSNNINLAVIHNYNTHLNINDVSINLYPKKDKEYLNLLKLISNYIHCDINNILLTNGSGEGLKLILKTFSNDDTNILIPTPNYPGFIHDAKLTSKNVNLVYFNGLENDISKLEDDIQKNDIIYFSLPNLPLGYEITHNSLLNLITKYNDKLFIIDEAYIEYGTNKSFIQYINYENIIITRTFSKAFALAGARLGYIVCNTKLLYYLNIPYCTKTITKYSILNGIKVMNNLSYYLDNVKKDKDNWNKFYNNIIKFINNNDIIYKISYKYGAYCLLYTKYPHYIVNIFKKYGYIIRDKSNDFKTGVVRITLVTKNIMDNIINLIKKINGYSKYTTYYLDLDETLRNDKYSEVYSGIIDSLNIINKNAQVNIITNSSENPNTIKKYLQTNNISYNELITPFTFNNEHKIDNINDYEYNNGYFIRNNKLYIIKFPNITK